MEVPKRFQDSAAKAGIPVTLIIHPGLRHTLTVPSADRERLREALIFLGRG
jgi:dipeptidyl aminopeptidase/acylaminoacyl peptidase